MSKPSPWMLLASTGLSVALLTGCGGPEHTHWDDVFPGKPDPSHEWRPGFETTDFETLYAANCRACHSDVAPEKARERGEFALGASLPLNDPLYLALIDAATLTKIIAQGIEGTSMPPSAVRNGGPLTDAQVADIVEGMRKNWGDPAVLKNHPNLPPYVADLGSIEAGKTAYATYCASCHGADGMGDPAGEKGHAILDPNYLALVSNQSLRTTLIVGRKDFGMPDYTGYVEAKTMSSQEISDVVAWMASHRLPVWKVSDEDLANQSEIKPTPAAQGNLGDMPGQPYGADPDPAPAAPTHDTLPPPAPEATPAPSQPTPPPPAS